MDVVGGSMDLTEIENSLNLSNPGAMAHWDQIIRDTGMYTTALFAITGSPNGDVLRLAGTGTLVVVEEAHYILTAAHVWQAYLKDDSDSIGVSLREKHNHKCLVETHALVLGNHIMTGGWNEWGPDFAFVKLPEVKVPEIEAYRVFYRLPAREFEIPVQGCLELDILMGVPYALGTFEQNHASVAIVGITVNNSARLNHDGAEYIDADVSLIPLTTTAKSFGGVSGGGLWRVRLFSNSTSGTIDSIAFLEGVAFYELNVVNGRGLVRCHSIASVIAAMPKG
jgi:hypothetical protein